MPYQLKTILPRKIVSIAVGALFAPSIALAFSPFSVKDIHVTGLQSTEPGMVLHYLPVRVGDTFTQDQATETVQRLYKTGLFDDVSINTKNNIVDIQVKERPVISSVLFEGMKAFDKKGLTESLSDVGFGVGHALNPATLSRAKDEIRSQYITKGQYGVEIDHTLTPLPNNRVGVSFHLQEGNRAKITDIHIVGNEKFSSSKLKDEMNLTTPGWMTWFTGSHRFSREHLDDDVQNLQDFYLNRGYLDAQVNDPQVTISSDKKDIQINYSLSEGESYKIKKIQLAGDLKGLNEDFQNMIVQQPGEVFNNSKAKQTSERIKSKLGELGYAFAEVDIHPITNPETQEVDITFFVEPGRRVYVRRINIGGNVRTRDQVIRREMRQQEAAWYDEARLSTSRDRIDRLGYFNDVDVTQAPVDGSADQVDVNVNVKEKPTGMINLGVGYGSTDKLSFQAGISQENIFGSGTDVSLQVSTGRYNRAATLTHTDPYFTRSGISRTSSLYYRKSYPYNRHNNLDYGDDSYQIKTIGFGQNFGIPISENDRIFMGATLEHNTIKLPSEKKYPHLIPEAYREFVDHYGTSSNVLMFNVGWTKDTRDSGVAPTRGHLTSLDATVGVGDLRYYILSAQEQYYLPLSKRYTLAFNVEADYGKTLGGGGKPFPVIKNMYAGGIGSVRGYEGASLGPRDTVTGDYLGGSTRVLANVQLYMPFPGTHNDRTLRWFLFGDAGKVGATGSTKCTAGNSRYGGVVKDPCSWRYSAGVGLSWQSPLGPLEISYAKPIHAKPGDNKQKFQFQIGTSF